MLHNPQTEILLNSQLAKQHWYHWVVKKLLGGKPVPDDIRLKNKKVYFCYSNFKTPTPTLFCMNRCDYSFYRSLTFTLFIIYYLYIHIHLIRIILWSIWCVNIFLQILTSSQRQQTYFCPIYDYIILIYITTIKCQFSQRSEAKVIMFVLKPCGNYVNQFWSIKF